MKRSGLETTVKETEVDQDHFKVIRFYREKMNQQPLHSALRSFNIQDGVRMSGVYEIHRNNEVSVRIFVDYGLFRQRLPAWRDFERLHASFTKKANC